MNFHLLALLQKAKPWQLWSGSVLLAMLLTVPFVSLMNWFFEGQISHQYIITGIVTGLMVALIVSGLLIQILGAFNLVAEEQRRLQAIIDASPVPMAVNDSSHNILLLNPAFTRLFGYTLNDIPTLEDWWPKAYPDEAYRQSVAESWQQHLHAMYSQHQPFQPLEATIRCKDGSDKIVLALAAQLGAEHRDIHLIVLYDITEKAEISAALTQSRNLLQSVIENIPMRVFWKDRDSRYLGCNSLFARDADQHTQADIIGKVDMDLSWCAQADLYRADDRAVMEQNRPKLAFDEPQTTPDGQLIWLRTSKVPLSDQHGQVFGVLGIYDDITQSKKIEDALWITQTILDKSKTAFFRMSPQGRVEYVNDYACESLGYSQEELVGMHPWQFDPDFSEEIWPATWQDLKTNGIVNIESRHRHKDGTLFNVDITGHFIAFKGDEFCFTFVQDVSERKRIETALRQKEGYQRALINNFPFMVWLKDTDSRFLAVNKALAETLGETDPDHMVGKSDFDYSPEELAELYRADDRQVMLSRQRKTVEEEHVDHLGNRRWIETFKAPVTDHNQELLGTVGFARDISDRKRIETDLRIAATAFESQEGMIITDADTIILKINQAFSRITGFSSAEVIGKRMNLLKSGIHDKAFYSEMWASINNSGSWQGEIWNRRKNGDIFPEWLTITAVKNQQGVVTHYVGAMLDITARKAIEEKVHHLAHYDTLTDLPNRTLFSDRLHQALAQARRDQGKLALLFLDLDKFKPINDDLGHDIGDLLLKEVAYRLQLSMRRENDTVCRLGGDEFVILLPSIDDDSDPQQVAEKVLTALTQPFAIEQHRIEISVSIGIALYPDHGQSSIALMKSADNSMYHAKHAGRSCYKVFSVDH